jgi:diguanylate cyclase (GGDEF)-like protein
MATASAIKCCINARRRPQEKLRKSDILGRIGGEEFAILLPHATALAAMRAAEKVRTAIASLVFSGVKGNLKVSASFGVAELDRAAATLDELLARAASDASLDPRSEQVMQITTVG